MYCGVVPSCSAGVRAFHPYMHLLSFRKLSYDLFSFFYYLLFYRIVREKRGGSRSQKERVPEFQLHLPEESGPRLQFLLQQLTLRCSQLFSQVQRSFSCSDVIPVTLGAPVTRCFLCSWCLASVPGLPRFDLPFGVHNNIHRSSAPVYYCERKRKVKTGEAWERDHNLVRPFYIDSLYRI